MREWTESFLTNIKVALGLCREVGRDAHGNRYFENTRSVPSKRWTLYHGRAEGSKTPSLWHAWLHHTIEEIPLETNRYDWQKPHLPNLTGTSRAYKPTSLTKSRYEAWKPEELS